MPYERSEEETEHWGEMCELKAERDKFKTALLGLEDELRYALETSEQGFIRREYVFAAVAKLELLHENRSSQPKD